MLLYAAMYHHDRATVHVMNDSECRTAHKWPPNFRPSRLDLVMHRVSEKLCQLIFCSLSVKYEPISIQIVRIVSEETCNKTVPKMRTSPKVCACTTLGNFKCQIELFTQ